MIYCYTDSLLHSFFKCISWYFFLFQNSIISSNLRLDIFFWFKFWQLLLRDVGGGGVDWNYGEGKNRRRIFCDFHFCSNIYSLTHSVSNVVRSTDWFKARGQKQHFWLLYILFWLLRLGIGWNFMIDNQLQLTDRLSIMISSSHFWSNWVLEV